MEKLSPEQIFNKTFVFVLLKIALAVAYFAVSLIILTILAAFISNSILLAVIWLVLTICATFAINYFVGYYVKAGHVSAIADAISVGMIPEDMLKGSFKTVKDRFLSCNEYFSYRLSLGGSVNQLQKTLNVFGIRYSSNGFVRAVISFLQNFIGLALNFMIDCCMGYTFLMYDYGSYTTASDSVIVYNLSWKRLCEKPLLLAVEIIVSMCLIFLFIFCIFAAFFTSVFDSNVMAGALGAGSLAFFAVSVIKNAFLDTNLLIKTMILFFDEAKYADITAEDYANACKASPKYEVLFRRAQSEISQSAQKEKASIAAGSNVPPSPQ